MTNFLSKQERSEIRECYQYDIDKPNNKYLIQALNQIDALEGQIESAYREGYQYGWSESDRGWKPHTANAWNKSKAKAALAGAEGE